MLTPPGTSVTPVTTGNPGMPPGSVMLRCCTSCALAARHAAASMTAASFNRSFCTLFAIPEFRRDVKRVSPPIAVLMGGSLDLLQAP